MLTVCAFKWESSHPILNKGRNTAQHVNVLRRMVARHYRGPHRFVCITDKTDGLDPEVEVINLWDDHCRMRSPHGPMYPSCYRRLKLFSKDAEAIVGKRFVWLDLDCVIVSDVTPLWDRTEDIVLVGKTNPTTYYNGSMILMTAGTRTQIWDEFDPEKSPRETVKAQQFGSDQGWISYKLGPKEKTWGPNDGVYSYRAHLIRRTGGLLPDNARIVFFNGKNDDPAEPAAQRHKWVRQNWV